MEQYRCTFKTHSLSFGKGMVCEEKLGGVICLYSIFSFKLLGSFSGLDSHGVKLVFLLCLSWRVDLLKITLLM